MAKVLVSMPEEFLNRIDEVAGSESRSRSELIRDALRTYIRKTPTINAIEAEKNAKLLDALLD